MSAPTLSDKSTGDDVVAALGAASTSLQGKTVLITGANIGLGLETGRVLASAGAHIVLACRGQANADEAAAKIKSSVPSAVVETLLLDLSDLKQVTKVADSFCASGRPLHVLINNAGIMASPFGLTKDGHEMQLGVCHFGHFALTEALMPALKAGSPSRVVNLSSVASWGFAPRPKGILFDDLDSKKHYDPWGRYGQAKLANILHANQLQRRCDAAGNGITAVSLHPGLIGETNLARHMGLRSALNMISYRRAWGIVFGERQKNTQQGVATSVFAALAPLAGSKAAEGLPAALTLTPGGYYSHCNEEKCRIHPVAGDEGVAKRLWEVSEQVVKDALAK